MARGALTAAAACALVFAGCPAVPSLDVIDSDHDGVVDGLDCAPGLATVFPGAYDAYGDGVDADCDGVDGIDADGDGHPREDDEFEGEAPPWDCDDADAAVHPGADDPVGDGRDADCDGTDGRDRDGDGFADLSSGGEDCDDGDAAIHPDADEVCDGVDNDCDGDVDGEHDDADGDGFSDCVDPTPYGFDAADGREAPLSAALHVHGSLSEYSATALSHTTHAETYGVDVIWWSDHDAMTMMLGRPGGFDFDGGALTDEFEGLSLPVAYGFEPISDGAADSLSEIRTGGPGGTGYYWHLEAEAEESAEWSMLSYEYTGAQFAHHLPLLADAEARLSIRPSQDLDDDWRLRVVFELSGNLQGSTNRIVYELGPEGPSPPDTDSTVFIPVDAAAGQWTELVFPLSADAAYFAEADDQGCHGQRVELRVRNGVRAGIDLDDYALTWQFEGAALRDRMAEMVEERYAGGPVTQFVGQEVTAVENAEHVNALGTGVPFNDYTVSGLLTMASAVDFVHDHGAVALCNHPFGVDTEVLLDGEDADVAVQSMAEHWLDGDGFGCDAIEVGYPARVLDLEHHLAFWDALGMAGVYLTGVGTSDDHWASPWPDEPNNHVSWVFLDVPSEQGIAEQVRAGRVFFGPPYGLVGRDVLLDLWSEHGAVMGQVLESDLDQVIHVALGDSDPGWELSLVVDGAEYATHTLDGLETDVVFELPREDHRVIRAEVRDAYGEALLLSNPLYLVHEGRAGPVPSHRRAF